MTIAFFDFDRTLIARNSASLWIRAELRDGFISRWQALRAASWVLRYHLGAADMQQAIRASIATLRGKREDEMRARARDFYDTQVRTLYRPGGLQAVAVHREHGDRVVLLTSSSPYVAEPVTLELGLDDCICSRFVVDRDGRFTGDPVEPLCFGAGKVELAERYATQHGVELARCTFYSDSASDLPMFEAVGTPVAVNPDPRLRRAAHRRGWALQDWGEPAALRSQPA